MGTAAGSCLFRVRADSSRSTDRFLALRSLAWRLFLPTSRNCGRRCLGCSGADRLGCRCLGRASPRRPPNTHFDALEADARLPRSGSISLCNSVALGLSEKTREHGNPVARIAAGGFGAGRLDDRSVDQARTSYKRSYRARSRLRRDACSRARLRRRRAQSTALGILAPRHWQAVCTGRDPEQTWKANR